MGGDDQLYTAYYTGSIFGGDGNDMLDGAASQYLSIADGEAGDDIINVRSGALGATAYGRDGNDTIYAGGDAYGGAGNDKIVASFSYYSPSMYGEAGDDEIIGDSSGDKLFGGTGADIIRGNGGADLIASGEAASTSYNASAAANDMGLEHDQLFGDDGDDVIWAGYGDDVDGGAGSDTLRLSLGGATSGVAFATTNLAARQSFTFGGGTIQNVETLDYLRGSEFDDNFTIATQATRLTVEGGSGNDTLSSGSSSVTFKGDAGDDLFVSGPAGDTFDGGAGYDIVDYRNATSSVTVFLGSTIDAIGSGGGGDALSHVEQVSGSAFSDTVTGSNQRDTLSGMAGDDVLNGGAGDDTLIGGTGADRLTGGADSDVLQGGDGDDVLYSANTSPAFTLPTTGGTFTPPVLDTDTAVDTLQGGEGDDRIFAGYGDNVDGGANGSAGDQLYLSLMGARQSVTVDFNATIVAVGGGTITGIESVRWVEGSAFGEVIIGRTAAEPFENGQIFGLGGDDRIVAGRMTSGVFGGDGNDVLDTRASQAAMVQIDGGTGDDVISLGAASSVVAGGTGRDAAIVAGSFRKAALTSSGGTQTLRNGTATDTISGVEDIRFADGHYAIDANSVGAQLQRLFDTVLHRAADQGGLEYWLDAINDRGLTLSAAAGAFLGSGEFRSGGASVASNGAFVDYVFATALGRPADAGGRSYWVGQLDAGLSRADALVSISESGEHRALTAGLTAQGYFETDDDYQYVALLFDAILGRTPDTGGLLYWGEQIKTGARSRGQVADQITGSAEFQAHVQGASNAALVDYAFNTALDRAPDAGGRAYWIDQLDHGVSVSSMMQSFATSPEHEQNYFGHIIGGIDVM